MSWRTFTLTSSRLRLMVATAAGLVVVAAVAMAICAYLGVYNVAAVEQHTKIVYWIVEGAMRRSVHEHSGGIRVPKLDGPLVMADGLRVYHDECEQCHGGPGVSPEPYALGLMPVAASLTQARKRWGDADIFWIVSNGLKMTAMPAWQHRLTEAQIWHVALFVSHALPALTPTEYAEALTRARANTPPLEAEARALLAGDPKRGRRAVQQYACITCHEIPGVTGAVARVGPPLVDIGRRTYIAGTMINREENMVAWLMAPSRIKKGTAMPDMAINEQDARDIAAFLETLRP